MRRGSDRVSADEAVAWLEGNAKRQNIEAMARYGIPSGQGVDMALRAMGKRTPQLRAAAKELAGELRESDHPSQTFIGRSALRAL